VAPAPPLKTEPEVPEAEGKARAQAIVEQAVTAYKDARYFDAVELFLKTNRIYPDSNLSRFESLLQHCACLRRAR
jgi:hypothetical protein